MRYPYITDALLRQHCRIDADDDTQDAVLALYLKAAHDWVLDACGRTEQEIFETWGEMPAPLIQAMLLMAGHNFAYREAGQVSNLSAPSRAVSYLVAPYSKPKCL